MSAGMRSSAITAHAPAASAIRACSASTTSMITPPLSISARPLLTRIVPVSCIGVMLSAQRPADESPDGRVDAVPIAQLAVLVERTALAPRRRVAYGAQQQVLRRVLRRDELDHVDLVAHGLERRR